jgi:cytoskeletal protein CcmA (bactofilin family)
MSIRFEQPWRPRPRISWLFAVLGLWALVPALAMAAEFRTGEQLQVGPQEVIDDDLYAFGRDVSIQGVVRGDLITAAELVDISGTVEGDVLAIASRIQVPGQVRGSLRSASGELTVSGPVGEDAMLAGGNVRLAPSAQVGKDFYVASGEVQVQAPVRGELRAMAGKLTLAAPVDGDVHAQVDTLQLADGARIGGDLDYRSERDAQVAQGAVVAGSMERLPVEHRERRAPVLGVLFFWARWLIGLFALGLLLVLVSPNFARRAPAMLRQQPWLSLGWGAALFVGLPLVAGLIFFLGLLIGGWWLGLFILALHAMALALCFPVVGMLVGRWLLERFHKTGAHLVVALLVGLVLLTLVGLVPILGWLVVMATLFFGLGAILLTAVKGRRPAEALV